MIFANGWLTFPCLCWMKQLENVELGVCESEQKRLKTLLQNHRAAMTNDVTECCSKYFAKISPNNCQD